MVYDYIVTLKRPVPKINDLVSQLMYLLSLVAFVYFAFTFNPVHKAYLFIATGIVGCWIWVIVKKRSRNTVYFTAGLALAAFGWFTQPYHNVWLGMLYIFAALVERELKFAKEIGFSKDEIVVNSLLKKKYRWAQVKNAMITEGILTIDLNNNKLIQHEIAEDVSSQTSQEFNAFCIDRLHTASV